MQKSQTEGFSQLAALGFSLDLKCVYKNPTLLLKATAKLMFVKGFSRTLGFWSLNYFRLGACLEQAVTIGVTKRTKCG